MNKASFYWQPQARLFIPALEVTTPQGMFIAAVIFAILTVVYEGFKCLRLNVAEKSGDRWNGIPCFSAAHMLQTLLFLVELVFGYIIMLTVMTYNVWLFLGIIVGSAVGYSLCQVLSQKHQARLLTTNPLGSSGTCTKMQEPQILPVNERKCSHKDKKGSEEETQLVSSV